MPGRSGHFRKYPIVFCVGYGNGPWRICGRFSRAKNVSRVPQDMCVAAARDVGAGRQGSFATSTTTRARSNSSSLAGRLSTPPGSVPDTIRGARPQLGTRQHLGKRGLPGHGDLANNRATTLLVTMGGGWRPSSCMSMDSKARAPCRPAKAGALFDLRTDLICPAAMLTGLLSAIGEGFWSMCFR